MTKKTRCICQIMSSCIVLCTSLSQISQPIVSYVIVLLQWHTNKRALCTWRFLKAFGKKNSGNVPGFYSQHDSVEQDVPNCKNISSKNVKNKKKSEIHFNILKFWGTVFK